MGLYDQERGEPSLRRDDIRRDVDKTDTLRATPFTDEVFEDRPMRRDGAGLPVTLIAGVVLGAVLVGGVVWYAFKGAGGPQLAPGEVQTIKADAAPYKMKPDNPGGMQVENQDKLVYDRVAKGAAPKREENLLPPPEEPKEPPKAPLPKAEPVTEVAKAPEPKEPPKDMGKVPEVKAPEAKAPETKAAETKAAEAKAPPAEKPPGKTAEKTMESIVKEANETPAKDIAKPAAPSSDAAALAAAVAAATKMPAAPPAKAPEPAARPAEVQTAAVTPAAPTAAGASGAFQIQLVSVPSEDAAQSEWKRISGRHKDLFAALTPSVTKADLGDRGIYYRLRAGPLADKAAADSLCAALAADKIGCIVVKP